MPATSHNRNYYYYLWLSFIAQKRSSSSSSNRNNCDANECGDAHDTNAIRTRKLHKYIYVVSKSDPFWSCRYTFNFVHSSAQFRPWQMNVVNGAASITGAGGGDVRCPMFPMRCIHSAVWFFSETLYRHWLNNSVELSLSEQRAIQWQKLIGIICRFSSTHTRTQIEMWFVTDDCRVSTRADVSERNHYYQHLASCQDRLCILCRAENVSSHPLLYCRKFRPTSNQKEGWIAAVTASCPPFVRSSVLELALSTQLSYLYPIRIEFCWPLVGRRMHATRLPIGITVSFFAHGNGTMCIVCVYAPMCPIRETTMHGNQPNGTSR